MADYPDIDGIAGPKLPRRQQSPFAPMPDSGYGNLGDSSAALQRDREANEAAARRRQEDANNLKMRQNMQSGRPADYDWRPDWLKWLLPDNLPR